MSWIKQRHSLRPDSEGQLAALASTGDHIIQKSTTTQCLAPLTNGLATPHSTESLSLIRAADFNQSANVSYVLKSTILNHEMQ